MLGYSNNLVLAVKEMLERNWSIDAMASKLAAPPHVVAAIVDFINNALT